MNHDKSDTIKAGIHSPRVSSYANQAAERISEYAGDAFAVFHANECGGCQSPIETLLLLALYAHNETKEWPHFPVNFAGYEESRDALGCIYTQYQIGRYTADFFAETHYFDVKFGLVIECDGHDFHEKTKQQAAHDKKRDRYLVSQGYQVIRFTGSEIHADPDACAQEVFQILEDWWMGEFEKLAKKAGKK